MLQQAMMLGAKVIGTASEGSFETVRQYGGVPVRYGDGLEQRVRELARLAGEGRLVVPMARTFPLADAVE